MRHERLWSFKTKNFKVILDCAPEDCPDLSWADEETLDKLERGVYVNVMFRVRVLHHGREIGSAILGNSVYENVREFGTAHRDPDPANRNCMATNAKHSIGHYFPDMVREAINEARSFIATLPELREIA